MKITNFNLSSFKSKWIWSGFSCHLHKAKVTTSNRLWSEAWALAREKVFAFIFFWHNHRNFCHIVHIWCKVYIYSFKLYLKKCSLNLLFVLVLGSAMPRLGANVTVLKPFLQPERRPLCSQSFGLWFQVQAPGLELMTHHAGIWMFNALPFEY